MGYYSSQAVAARGESLVIRMERSFSSASTCSDSPSWGRSAFVPPKVTSKSASNVGRSFEWLHVAAQ